MLVRKSNSHVLTNIKAQQGLRVQLPNDAIIRSTAIGNLHLPTLDISAHIFPDKVLTQTLLSVPTLVNAGCTATFTSKDVNITNGDATVAYGTKDPLDTLWIIDLEKT